MQTTASRIGLWVLALALAASAQGNLRFQGDQEEAKTRIFAGYWLVEFGGDMSIGDDAESPSNINMRTDLDVDLDQIGTPYFELVYTDAAAFISAEYWFVQGRGKEVLETDLNYDGLRFVEGGLTSSKLTAQAVSLNLGYALFSEFGVDVYLVAGMRYIAYASKVSQVDAGSARNRAESYMPTIGLRGETKLFGDLTVYADVNWLEFSIEDKSYVADHFDWSIGAFYDFTDYLSAHAEWAYRRNHLHRRNEEYDLELQGLKLGIAFRF